MATSAPASASARAIARPTRAAPPVTSATFPANSLTCRVARGLIARYEGAVRNWLKVRFITGFFVTVPAIATAWLLYVFWDAIDSFFSPGYERIFGRRIPGLGFLTAILLILVMGTIATNVVGRRILARHRAPAHARAHLPQHLSHHQGAAGVVLSREARLVQGSRPRRAPRKGEFVFGFVTSELLVEGPEGKRQMVTVFVPTNNLYLGDVIVVPREEALATGLSVEEGIRIILSAGTASPPAAPPAARLTRRPSRGTTRPPLLPGGRASRRRSGRRLR